MTQLRVDRPPGVTGLGKALGSPSAGFQVRRPGPGPLRGLNGDGALAAHPVAACWPVPTHWQCPQAVPCWRRSHSVAHGAAIVRCSSPRSSAISRPPAAHDDSHDFKGRLELRTRGCLLSTVLVRPTTASSLRTISSSPWKASPGSVRAEHRI